MKQEYEINMESYIKKHIYIANKYIIPKVINKEHN